MGHYDEDPSPWWNALITSGGVIATFGVGVWVIMAQPGHSDPSLVIAITIASLGTLLALVGIFGKLAVDLKRRKTRRRTIAAEQAATAAHNAESSAQVAKMLDWIVATGQQATAWALEARARDEMRARLAEPEPDDGVPDA